MYPSAREPITQRLGASIGHGHLVRNPIRSNRKSVIDMTATLKTPKGVAIRGEGNKPQQASSIGLIIRQKEPKVLETPVDRVDSFLTPTELFYVRSHSPAPKLELASYRLHIDGAVRSPLALTYQELRDMPAEKRVAILECAGNSRVFLVPEVRGAQWELGAVGNAEWTGVPLRALLERAGLEEDACEIVLEGPDRAVPKEGAVPPGPICYARSLPRAKALQREVLIAYQMNGRDPRYARSSRVITQWLPSSG